MFFSYKQIEASITRLSELNSFFGTVFLAFKKAGIPVNHTKSITFSKTIEDFLQEYYRPGANYSEFYTPFKTTNKSNRWNKKGYADTLHQIAKNTFSEVFIHPTGKQWGWQADYIKILKERDLKGGLIPAFDLAIWLLRSRRWDTDTTATDVVEFFFKEFNISDEERSLFDTSIPPLTTPWLQKHAVTDEVLLNIIGVPGDFEEEGAMLELLRLTGVGPARKIEYNLAQRLNLITGDNGLGKTFLLECAWWALTGTWAGIHQAYPRQDVTKNHPSIAFQINRNGQPATVQTAKYDWDRDEWITSTRRNVLPGLSIFSQIDGSFAIWDPAKRLSSNERLKFEGSSEALLRFSPAQVWNGIEGKLASSPIWLCNGLIRDWFTWQTSDPARFTEFSAALQALSPHPTDEPLIPGQPTRLPPDSRPIPTLKFSYGEVPITLCSAGIQRIVALAYLLIWAWHEHVETSKIKRKELQKSIVLLIDEMEAHLHPFWQRAIVPALMDVVQALAHEVQTQMIIATHSPLVLASVEDRFDQDRDKLFHLYLENEEVKLNNIPFVKRGRVDLWLMSDLFGLKQPRSQVAEETIEEAKHLQQTRQPSREEVKNVSDKLVKVLAPDDEFWPRWTYFAEQRGVQL